MRKLLLLSLLPLVLFLTPSIIYAQNSTPPDNKRSGEIVTLSENEVIDRDFFATGETVEIFGTVNGDVYVAGGMVTVRGTINGDLLVAGGDLNIAGVITDDVRAAGGNIEINADIGKNLTVLGGNVDITQSANIAGSLVSGAGNVNVSGPVGKDITAGAGSMTLADSVGGNVVSGVGELRITSQAQLGGDLYYYSEEDANIASEASVSGTIQRNDPPARFSSMDEQRLKEDTKGFLEGVTTAGKMISFVSILIVGLLIIKLFPNYSENVVSSLKKSSWRSLGFGFLTLIGTPIIAILVMVTLIGIPMGLIGLAFYLIALYISKVFVMLWAGQFLMEKVNRKSSIYANYTLGLIAYSVVSLIPVVGGIMKLFVLLFSLGAMLLTCRKSYEDARKANIY